MIAKLETQRAFFLTLVGSLLVPFSAKAELDFDDDGMSDVWEATYGFSTSDNGSQFADQAPDADMDGDGLSNLMESLAGTDPDDNSQLIAGGSSAPGKFAPAFDGSMPENTLEAHMWYVQGKCYEVFFSDDLKTWVSAGKVVRDANSGEVILSAVSNADNRLFVKIEASDVDQDGDSLSDYEERLLGTNPNGITDSDSDGLADEWEMATIGDLSQGADSDVDGDGIKLLDEYRNGLNPNADDSQRQAISENYTYDFTRLTGVSSPNSVSITFAYDRAGNITQVSN